TIVKPTIAGLQKEWSDKPDGGHLQVNFTEDHLFIVQANPTLLFIAINNIIGNAFKFSNRQDVFCHLSAQQDQLCLKVSDSGPGINPAIRQEIFKPFFSSAEQESHKGNGMGNMEKRAANIGAAFRLQAAPGKGTSISILMAL
ncbi:MAG: ATP-binding protein, partial [Chitinophagaceae bacterium]